MNFEEFISTITKSLMKNPFEEKRFWQQQFGNFHYICLDNIQISMSIKEREYDIEALQSNFINLYKIEEFDPRLNKLELYDCSFYFNNIEIIQLSVFIINFGSNTRASALPTTEFVYNDEGIKNMMINLCKFLSTNVYYTDNLISKITN